MATPAKSPTAGYDSDRSLPDRDGQAPGQRRFGGAVQAMPMHQGIPSSHGLSAPAGSLLRGATHPDGTHKDPALLVGIKLDLEAEVHLTARVRGDITLGLY